MFSGVNLAHLCVTPSTPLSWGLMWLRLVLLCSRRWPNSLILPSLPKCGNGRYVFFRDWEPTLLCATEAGLSQLSYISCPGIFFFFKIFCWLVFPCKFKVQLVISYNNYWLFWGFICMRKVCLHVCPCIMSCKRTATVSVLLILWRSWTLLILGE